MTGGVSEEEILKAFTACIETAPERVTFFPRDFLKWRKVSRTRRPREQREDQGREERQACECDRAREREQLFARARGSVLAGTAKGGGSAATLEEGAGMSEGLNTRMGAEELYGVDGDGLGEGEVSCEAELGYDLWARDPSYDAPMPQAKSRT